MKPNSFETISKRTSLALPLELEEGPPPIYARLLIFALCTLVFGLLLWANLAKVRELSIAAGELVPNAPIHTISHIEGGIVEEVFVQEGVAVKAGEPLLKLRPETSGGEFERLLAQKASLEIAAERLDALLEGRQPDFSAFASKWQPMIAEQQTLYTQSSTELSATLATLEQQLNIAKAEHAAAAGSIPSIEQQAQLAKEQFDIQEALYAEEFTSRMQFLDAQTNWLKSEDTLTEARSRVEQTYADITRLRSEYDRSKASFQRQISTERADIASRLAELTEPLKALDFVSQSMTVTASTDGHVKKIHVAGPGSVIAGGQTILEILPNNVPLIAEVQVLPQDIGSVHVGQRTEIVVSAYDPNRFGKAQGEVTFISPGTFIDENTGLVYFLARVSLDQSMIGEGRYAAQLTNGMTISAEIITRKRSIAEYLLKPIVRSVDTAFSES